jgi:two-component system sensor histidine kinase BaeS
VTGDRGGDAGGSGGSGTADRGRRGRHAGWHGRAAPPWWPENEPWPPRRGPWRRRRSPLARGFGCLFGLAFLIGLAGVVGIVASIVAAAGPLGALTRGLGLVILVVAAVGLVVAGRTLRRAAAGLDDLGEAAEHVEAGDFSTRVREPARGPYPIRELSRRFNAMVARLEADEAQRRTLLADVSHELRTPLAVVQGNLEAILDGVHPADEVHLAGILDETRVLSRLVDDLRTVALSESGRLALHRESTDLAILATDVTASFGPAAEAAGVTLGLDIADDLPLLEIDPIRVREVLANLVANALHHTPRGGSIRMEASAAEGRDVVVSVRDTGAGIDPALLPHLFDRFAKGPDSRGSGLGLAIARGIVEAHGGSIEVASETGRGTVFTLRLPASPPVDG